MANFTIPEHLVAGFKKIFELDKKIIDQLSEFLKNTPKGTGPITFHQKMEEVFGFELANDISDTLFSFGSLLHAYPEKTVSNLAETITSAFSGNDENVDIKDFQSRLEILIGCSQSIRFTFKTAELLTEDHNIFEGCRIFSDIRLVFHEVVEQKDRNAIIIHRLRLEYHESENSLKEFHLSMSRSELMQLQKQIIRAIEKDDVIRSDYKDNMTFVDVTP